MQQLGGHNFIHTIECTYTQCCLNLYIELERHYLRVALHFFQRIFTAQAIEFRLFCHKLISAHRISTHTRHA